MYRQSFTVKTSGRALYPLTQLLDEVIQNSAFKMGMCNVFVHHTSASLILCENADPSVQVDLETFMLAIPMAIRFGPTDTKDRMICRLTSGRSSRNLH